MPNLYREIYLLTVFFNKYFHKYIQQSNNNETLVCFFLNRVITKISKLYTYNAVDCVQSRLFSKKVKWHLQSWIDKVFHCCCVVV